MTVRHSVVALLLSLTFTAAHAGFLEDFYDSSSGAGQANVTAAGIYESAHLLFTAPPELISRRFSSRRLNSPQAAAASTSSWALSVFPLRKSF